MVQLDMNGITTYLAEQLQQESAQHEIITLSFYSSHSGSNKTEPIKNMSLFNVVSSDFWSSLPTQHILI